MDDVWDTPNLSGLEATDWLCPPPGKWREVACKGDATAPTNVSGTNYLELELDLFCTVRIS